MSVPCPGCGLKKVMRSSDLCADCLDKGMSPVVKMELPPPGEEKFNVDDVISQALAHSRRMATLYQAQVEYKMSRGEPAGPAEHGYHRSIKTMIALAREDRARKEKAFLEAGGMSGDDKFKVFQEYYNTLDESERRLLEANRAK